MEYKDEFDAEAFNFWSGACDTYDSVEAAGLAKEFQSHIEEVFADRTPTATEINDYVWFERDSIYAALGLDENGEKNDE